MIRRYFEEEMRYLHEAGRLFAEAHPEQARYLNIDSVTDRDPYVERLFEGFAFLAGRIHERLDDELQEYTESLCRLLYPQYLRPIPSLSLAQMRAKARELPGTKVLEKGTEVQSDPVGEERTVCRFVTTQNVRLQPISLKDAEIAWPSAHTSTLTLRFQLEGNVPYDALDLDPLRIHFFADATTSSFLHLFFTRHVTKVEVEAPETNPLTLFGQKWVQPGGFGEDEGLLPYSPYTFSGYQALQEYLAFRRKFWCADISGLDRFAGSEQASTFEVRLHFDRAFPHEYRFSADQLKLFCSPIVNLFEQDAEPTSVDHRVPQYRVVASARHQVEVYDIVRGVGIEEKTGRRREYAPFLQFQHARDRNTRYFTSSSRFGPDGRYETHVMLDNVADGQELLPETLSFELWCTNGTLPREKLQEGMISRLAPGVPDVVNPINLTQPTLIQYPPIRQSGDLYWKLISHWSLNFQSVASAEALQGLLELYDWTSTEANRRRIAGIREVEWAPKELVERGVIRRGAEVKIKVQEDHFADEGDVALFGLVLSHFFAAYATLNSFVHVTVEALLSGKTYQWQPTRGNRPLV